MVEVAVKHIQTDLPKARGMLFGLAIGDALGWPTEFLKLPEIKRRYGPNGIMDLPDPALFTDDTQMSIALAEALIRAGDQDIDTFMAAVREEFVKWRHSPENNRAPGNTCLTGIHNLERGAHWTESGLNSKGCGSAMRAAPIGYLFQHHPEKLRAVAHATGTCTYAHRTADAACIGAAYLVKLALDSTPPDRMIPELLTFTHGISLEFDKAIHKVQECLSWTDPETALHYLGEGWIAEEAVALALYCFLKHPGSYADTIIRAANTNGDSDSIACIAGVSAGRIWGLRGFPAIGSGVLKRWNIWTLWQFDWWEKKSSRFECSRFKVEKQYWEVEDAWKKVNFEPADFELFLCFKNLVLLCVNI